MAATVFLERKLEDEMEGSTCIVTAAEVRRAPYHNRLLKRSPETRELASLDLRDLHSQPWKSKVHVYDVVHVHDGVHYYDGTNTKVVRRDFATCPFSRQNGEYTTLDLEELRSRIVKDLKPHGESDAGRLYVLEDVTPPVLEIMGWTLQLEPAVFLRHIENSWGHRKDSLDSSHTLPSAWPGGIEECLDLTIRYPRLVAVSHPSALKHENPEWRDDCLKRAARHLQGKQLFPVLDLPEESKVNCVTFDHCTVSVKVPNSNRRAWQGIVLFPHSIKEWTDGHLHVKKQELRNPEFYVQPLKKYEALTDDADVSRWLSGLESPRDHGVCSLPNFVFSTLWLEALGHWKLHAHQMALAVEMLSNSSSKSEETGLEAQRQLRAVIVRGAAMILDVGDDIQRAIDFFVKQAEHMGQKDRVVSRLKSLQSQYSQVKTQLERHLPTLQNRIDFTIVRQQVRLAETQLEESRKAIQQADTIKRLTILAFIYIPVQTAAAVFGMNLQELSPNPPIWVFFATAATLLVVTVSAAGWHRLVPFVYRCCNAVFGSVQTRSCHLLRKVGLQLEGFDRRGEKLSAWQRDPEPSWFQ